MSLLLCGLFLTCAGSVCRAEEQTACSDREKADLLPVTLATTALFDGAAGLPYKQTIVATGGSGIYVYTASGLPAWLKFDGDGTLHGDPGASDVGSVSFSVTATDSCGTALQSAFHLKVNTLAVEAAGEQNLGAAEVGGKPAYSTLTFRLNGNYELAAPPFTVLTDGVTGGDFTAAEKESTATSDGKGPLCSVRIAFAPAAAGPRTGAVQLVDANGNILATRAVFGNGKGTVAGF
ncbi:putative Ig domain-containing protein [Telmatobacter bradus]|uniref:putative Ig domain-containing protein n=1 Tax=Telmatobacter bradus TaxID=474953 RepID=UPI003B43C4C1